MSRSTDGRPAVAKLQQLGRRRKRRGALVLLAVVAGIVVVLAAAVLIVRQPVTVDGRTVWVPRGVTVGALRADGLLGASPGDLLSVKGAVLRKGGGRPAVVTVGGSVAASATPVGFGASVTSRRGADATETTTSEIVGRDRVTMGAISRQEISRVSTGFNGSYGTTVPVDTGGRKLVALTFDDGPWQGQTQKVLEVLLRYHAKGTFFMVGRQAEHLPYLSRLVVADGMEVGEHSQTHRPILHASKAIVTYEIAVGARTVQRYSGAVPTWYRPAGGTTGPVILSEAARLDLRVALWTLDSTDWTKPGAAKIAKRVLDRAQPGAIILMHDGGGNRSQTIAALPLIIQGLAARGYKMVTMSELYGLPPQKVLTK